ncbi:RNA polymerase sigma-70 factor [Chitinophaga pendula]|uniref:RNA polymerase sigma-70 factor n=1 Tax=Chitinophaga TaxID=79328 RepID=UPI0012FD4B58|nr:MULTISPECIES: RNA polymerase sigma-70 factor [Chitinophaga]UCJ05295.1 RNA polymerase sigma-70 factor [Chitinophaga pendula]
MTSDQFEQLFYANYKQLVCFANKLVLRLDVAEDIVQGVFINAWKQLSRLDPNQSVKAYLYRATRNACLNYLKSDYRSKTILTDQVAHLDQTQAPLSQSTYSLQQQLKDILDELPPRRKEIFLLSREQGLSYKEIASTMDISVKTVENQMGKAIKYLYTRITPLLKTALFIFFH